jgi:hypothetical protein
MQHINFDLSVWYCRQILIVLFKELKLLLCDLSLLLASSNCGLRKLIGVTLSLCGLGWLNQIRSLPRHRFLRS